MDSFFIRPETPDDISAIFEVNFQAFAHYDEANLVNTLRDSNIFNPELSLVAVCGARIIGHIMFPPITIESPLASTPAVALAPLVVHPDYQCLGVGITPAMGFARHGLMVSWPHLLLLMMYSWYLALFLVHSMEFRAR
jgi:predicted N-acetyltransferase YhbS